MATYNKKTGLYEAYKLVNSTNQLIVGTGKTKAEALFNFKDQLVRYRKNPLIKTDRNTKARPELTAHINEEIAKEDLTYNDEIENDYQQEHQN